jgi:hypothetical protein
MATSSPIKRPPTISRNFHASDEHVFEGDRDETLAICRTLASRKAEGLADAAADHRRRGSRVI